MKRRSQCKGEHEDEDIAKWAATVAILVALTGCAGTELHQEAVTSNDLHEARRQMDSAPLPVPGASRVDEPDEALGGWS